ncbi:bifunctional (p)ppGpp synthetase/guanosine-3',5'-bis(diphosphate) 3'-pyrophosphohydrolase [bacterium]|nr:bifunctional (p)ppGpp synthetase/guanosine-3',5'-bis(diphosphate) 3'-pyrophosphohydrolase [bacterium]
METPNFEKDFSRILLKLKRYSKHPINRELLRQAFEFSREAHRNQLRKSGAPYFVHCVEVAKILCNLHMDYVTIVGGLLHDVVEDTGVSIEEVRDKFGEEIAGLVDGVTKISELKFDSVEVRQAENFRKMLLSMVKDIRVILIKFADRLHNMRTIEYLPEKKQRRIALETREIYAPLAHRLGIAKMRWELEDLAFKTLAPQAYWNLVNKIAEKREEREAYINRFTAPIRAALRDSGITAKITGRPKHLYSIFLKMLNRDKSFEEIFDLLAVRIVVKRTEDCYFVLGIVHNQFTPVAERFKDYIATPKSNLYQSLHTTVFGADGKMVEIQIRTEDMHRTAEVGVAAHWRYKEGKQKADELDKQLTWLRQMLEWQHDTDDPKEFMENLRIDLFQDEVFVFTPKGRLHKLPLGSTPVDFAFAVHTDIGIHCIGAKVNGRIVPLNYKLKSGDTVEIITSANQRPNKDWIKFVQTSKARAKIKRWLKESMVEQSQKLGEEMLERMFKRVHVSKSDIDLDEVAPLLGCHDATDLHAAVGRGDISAQSVVAKILPEEAESEESKSIFKKIIDKARGVSKGVRVQGLDNLLINFGKCCQPVPGDRILGFLNQGRGVVVHRSDCKNILRLLENPERRVEVQWDVEPNKHFMVRLQLLGEDRKHFLRDVSDSISQTDTNIVSIEMRAEDAIVHSNIIIEVKNLQHLTRVTSRISKVNGVFSVERVGGTDELIAQEEVY